jgi:glycogen debranching enzyme
VPGARVDPPAGRSALELTMAERPIDAREAKRPDRTVYQAADPGYTSNFSRDSFTYGLLAEDLEALRAQVEFSRRHQGRRADPETGEEPGKIHHEWPGVRLRGLWTTYNACDTTALFVLALAHLARRGERDIVRRCRKPLESALECLLAHLYDDVFYEDVKQSGAERFALKVTYWKDSELNVDGVDREPVYPIAYSLVHFMAKTAIRAAARLTRSDELRERAAAMTWRGFETFWRGDHFAVAVQGDGTTIDTPSSDSLHTLLYLRRDEIAPADAERIVAYSRQLETPRGYLAALPRRADADEYHTRWVWVHEQALLHAAARRHGLAHAEAVCERIVPTLDSGFPELIDPTSGAPAGNPMQLWSIGAHVYFQRVRVAKALTRLVDDDEAARGAA